MPVEWLKQIDVKSLVSDARREEPSHLGSDLARRSQAVARSRPVVEAQGLELLGPYRSGRLTFEFTVSPDDIATASVYESATVNGVSLADGSWQIKPASDGRLVVGLEGTAGDDLTEMLSAGTVDLRVQFKDDVPGSPVRSVHAFTVRGTRNGR